MVRINQIHIYCDQLIFVLLTIIISIKDVELFEILVGDFTTFVRLFISNKV